MSVIMSYVKAIGVYTTFGIIFSLIVSTSMDVSSSIWLASAYLSI